MYATIVLEGNPIIKETVCRDYRGEEYLAQYTKDDISIPKREPKQVPMVKTGSW